MAILLLPSFGRSCEIVCRHFSSYAKRSWRPPMLVSNLRQIREGFVTDNPVQAFVGVWDGLTQRPQDAASMQLRTKLAISAQGTATAPKIRPPHRPGVAQLEHDHRRRNTEDVNRGLKSRNESDCQIPVRPKPLQYQQPKAPTGLRAELVWWLRAQPGRKQLTDRRRPLAVSAPSPRTHVSAARVSVARSVALSVTACSHS
jgi:hypothetical protein